MQEIRDIRDPFVSEKEYKKRVIGKTIFNIIVVILIISFVALGILLYMEDIQRTAEQKFLTQIKCTSVCPVEVRPAWENPDRSIRFFDESCYAYCANLYKGDITARQLALIHENKGRININEFNECFTYLTTPSFDYLSCYNNFLNNHAEIKNFTSYSLPYSYPRYEYELKVLECSDTFAKIDFSYVSGYYNLSVFAGLKKKDGTKLPQSDFGIVTPKNLKSIILTYPAGLNRDNVAGIYINILLKDNSTLTYRTINCES